MVKIVNKDQKDRFVSYNMLSDSYVVHTSFKAAIEKPTLRMIEHQVTDSTSATAEKKSRMASPTSCRWEEWFLGCVLSLVQTHAGSEQMIITMTSCSTNRTVKNQSLCSLLL